MFTWNSKKENPPVKTTTLAVVSEQKHDLVPVDENSDIVIHKGKGALIQVRTKELKIAGVNRQITANQLIGMIKRITQEIGSYKDDNDIYAIVVVRALRKARGDFVNTLENEFGIHWQINAQTGESVFYM